MTRFHFRPVPVLLAVLLAGAALPAVAAPLDVKAIDAVFDKLPQGSPGCALGVYDHGQAVLLKGYGLANLENRVPVTVETRFNIGSVSKQFTAMSAIILAEQGKLSLDDDIRKYLPEMPGYGTPVTVRMLINHTSGIRNYFDLLFIKGLSHKDPVTPDEVYDVITRVSKPEFTPGSRHRYNNSGYFLLGRIVERVSGASLARFEADNIFMPLGMSHTQVPEDFNQVIPNRAYGYVQAPGGGYRTAGSAMQTTGDGAITTTVGDLAKWDADFYAGKVWRPAVKAEMLRITKLSDGQPVTADPGVYYVGGLNMGERRGLKYLSHGGKDLGFMADLTRYPDQQLTVALLCNQIFRIGEVVDGVTDLLLSDRYTKPAEPASPPRQRAGPTPGAAISGDLLKSAPGTYYSSELDAVYVIEARDGGLGLRIGPHQLQIGPLQGLGEDAIGLGGSRVQLRRDAQSKVTGFTVEGFDFVRR
jgi:CubicO group peptidase (beta-lactamase class C family)